MDRFVIPALKAFPIALALWLMLAFAAGKFTWELGGIGLGIFVVLWFLMRGKPPARYHTPPSPDENQTWWS